MLFAVFLAVFLPCAGMSVVLIVYCCMLWYAATYRNDVGGDSAAEEAVKNNQPSGLSPTQLQKLPSVTGKDLVLGEDCAVCLDVIGADEPARLVPGCNHGFHVECADTWLAKHPACPVCRNWLGPELFDPPETNPC